MSDELLRAGSYISDEVAAKLLNAATEEYNTEVDAMFGRLHNDTNYNPADYRRVGFDDKQQAYNFTQEMLNKGVNVVMSPVKLNGQYLAEVKDKTTTKPDPINSTQAKRMLEEEIRKNFEKLHSAAGDTAPYNEDDWQRFECEGELETASDFQQYIQNNAGNEPVYMYLDNVSGKYIIEMKKDPSNNNAEQLVDDYNNSKEDGKAVKHYETTSEDVNNFQIDYLKRNTHITTAESLIRQYENDTFTKVDDVKPLDTVDEPESTLHSGASELKQKLYGETDDLGKAASKAEQIYNDYELYIKPFSAKAAEKEAMQTDLRIGRGTQLKKAIYFDGYAIVDGELASAAETAFVLKEHDKRYKDAAKIVTKKEPQPNIITKTIAKDRFERQVRMRENAKKLNNSVYSSEEMSFEEYASVQHKSQALRQGGTLEELKVGLNTEAHLRRLSANKILKASGWFYDSAAVNKVFSELKSAGIDLTNSTSQEFVETVSSLDIDKLNVSNSVKDDLRKLKSLNTTDAMLQAGGWSMNAAKVLKNELGLDFTNGYVTREDLLEITTAFNDKMYAQKGISFITENGDFDIKMFKSYSARDLGISEEMYSVIEQLNSKDGWGGINFGKVGRAGGIVSNLAVRITGDKDLSDMVNTTSTTVRVTKKGVSASKNFAAAIKRRTQARKARKVGQGKGNVSNRAGRSKPKKNKQPQTHKYDAKANQKFADKQAEKLKKLNKSEKSIITKAENAKAEFAKQLTGTTVRGASTAAGSTAAGASAAGAGAAGAGAGGAAGTVAGAGAGAGLGTILIVAIACLLGIIIQGATVIVILQGVSSFLMAPDEDAYKKTIAYQVMEKLDKQQDDWFKQLAAFKADGEDDMDYLFKHREDMLFGVEAMTYEDYIGTFNNIIPDPNSKKTLYINPFCNGTVSLASLGEDGAEGLNENVLTKRKKFDGASKVIINSNLNRFSQKNETGAADDADGTDGTGDTENPVNAYAAVENGHTDNIKDIMTMLDVMYSLELDENSDQEMTSILGMSPAAYQWEGFKENLSNLWTKIKNFFHNAVEFFKSIASFFKGESTEKDYVEIGDGTTDNYVSYKTLQAYCILLYEVSHQQILHLSVDFFPVANDIEFTVDGAKTMYTTNKNKFKNFDDIEIHNLGVCLDPDTNDFKVDADGINIKDNTDTSDDYIFPYLEDEGGTKYDLSDEENGFSVVLNLEDNMTKEEREKLCVWKGMGSNEETYKRIKDCDCWSKDESVIESRIDPRKPPTKPTDKEGYTLNNKDSFTRTYWKDGGTDRDGNQIWNLIEEKFTRNCEGHQFLYCGGHISVISQGIAYSVTHEQLAMLNAYDQDYQMPTVKDYVLEDHGYDDFYGKYIIGSEDKYGTAPVDYSSLSQAVKTGACVSPFVDIQGSIITSSAGGLNLYVDGDVWKGDASGEDCFNIRDDMKSTFNFRDIFDADCFINKGCNVFPTGNDNDYKSYEGWSEDNMTLVVLKTAAPWYDYYKFDRPVEFGMTQLDNEDIDTVVKAVKENCSSLSEAREKAIRRALAFVGRGHYVEEGHEDHAFLSKLCEGTECEVRDDSGALLESISYDGNCTAGNSKAFAEFILYWGDKISNTNTNLSGSGYSYGSLQPADIIIHEEKEDDGDGLEKDTDGKIIKTTYRDLELTKDDAKNLTAQALRTYEKAAYSIYIGKSDTDITLHNGTLIKAGQPITVDLNIGGMGREIKDGDTYVRLGETTGTVYLRTWESESLFDYMENKEPPEPEDDDSDDSSDDVFDEPYMYNNVYSYNYPNYYWVKSPDERTKVYKFE